MASNPAIIGGEGGAAGGLQFTVVQGTHEFSVLDCIYYDGDEWTKARADNKYTMAMGVVVAVADDDTFTVAVAGRYDVGTHSMPRNSWMFVSDTDFGGLQTNEPVLSQPILYVESTSHVIIYAYRPGLTLEAFQGEGGESDHGALSGLTGDDHPQYLNRDRGDVFYYPREDVDSLLANLTLDVSAVTGLQALLDGQLTDDAPSDGQQYVRQDGAWILLNAVSGGAWGGITGTLSDQTDLQAALDSKADGSDLDQKADEDHIHSTADVGGLDTALAGKAAASHSHATSDVTGLDTALAAKADASALSGKADAANVLALDNTTPFTPDADYKPATKKYVDDNAGGGGGIPEAPQDGKQYARKDADWEEVVASSGGGGGGSGEKATVKQEIARYEGSFSELDFDNLPTDCDAFILEAHAHSVNTDATSAGYRLFFNGDFTENNYHRERMESDNGSSGFSEASSPSIGWLPTEHPNVIANAKSFLQVSLPNPGATDRLKTATALNYGPLETGRLRHGMRTIVHMSMTAAITRLTLRTDDYPDNIVGTFVLYSVKEIDSGVAGKNLIQTITDPGAAGFVFDNIPQQYNRLILKGFIRSELTGSSNDSLTTSFNSDTTDANYRRHGFGGVDGAEWGTVADNRYLINAPSADTPVGAYAQFEMVIEGYAGGHWKTAMADYFSLRASDQMVHVKNAIVWKDTSAITRIDNLGRNASVLGTVHLYGEY